LKEKAFPYSGIILAAVIAAWLGPGIAWSITGSDRTAFLIASITSALLGLLFLLLCLPLAGFMDRSQRETLGPIPKLLDLVVRHFLGYVGWPQSRRGWIIRGCSENFLKRLIRIGFRQYRWVG
jgi:hypothetical protein